MKELLFDIAVIGGGAGGLAAAIAAAEGGANVALFEKRNHTGGFGKGPLAIESSLQFKKLYSLTVDEAFKIHMDFTHWRVDAKLVRAYYDKSASTIDWLENMGVVWGDLSAHNPGFNYTWHVAKESPGDIQGETTYLWPVMNKRARELGVRFYLKTPAKKLIQEGDRINGLVATDESGTEIRVKSRAVIIATGGFGDNPEWIKQYTGFEWGRDFFSMRIPGMVGDGIRMAWEAGGARDNMTMQLTWGFADNPGGIRSMGYIFHQPNLIVNLLGERFINEEIVNNGTFTANAIAVQKKRCAFTIFDEYTKELYVKTGLDYPGTIPEKKVPNFDADVEQVTARGSKSIFVAGSIEELADKTGIHQKNLLRTIGEYNKACETGRDLLFNKKARYLRKVAGPSFFACKHVPGAYGSLGGIKINHKAEVINSEFDAVPGLYAAGVDANSIYGDSYVFILPGNTMGFAFNTGRIAAENALEYIKTIA
jgi:fumarate reductase flavoprotein subunit